MTTGIKSEDRPEVDLVPLSLFSQRIAEGWSMVPGYPLQPGDYAVTMMAPGFPKPRSNKSVGAAARNEQRWANARARRELA